MNRNKQLITLLTTVIVEQVLRLCHVWVVNCCSSTYPVVQTSRRSLQNTRSGPRTFSSLEAPVDQVFVYIVLVNHVYS